MVNALIVGAGAIGRGFLPWCLPENSKITFVDSSHDLIKGCRDQGGYTTFMTKAGTLQPLHINKAEYLLPSELAKLDLQSFDVAFISVGPRNVERLPTALQFLKVPIYSLENDPATVFRIREILNTPNVFFGIPDVITSSTASPSNLAKDPFSLHTENGVLYLENCSESRYSVDAKINAVWLDSEKLSTEWDAKLYIHNTPHCIAAYLGYLNSNTFMHEAMSQAWINDLVSGVIDEILKALESTKQYDSEFLRSYAIKELARFENKLLYDPITRVARQPLRKLRPAPHGRLIGALELCFLAGFYPKNLITGICAALHYTNSADDDYSSLSLINDYGISSFLWHYLSISPDTLLSRILSKAYQNFNPRIIQ